MIKNTREKLTKDHDQGKRMKIVIISEYTSRELYIVNRILTEYPTAVVVRPETNESPSSETNQIKSHAGRFTWKLHRMLWDRKFFPGGDFPEGKNTLSFPYSKLNRPEGIRFISDLNPDILITCRAPLLSDEIIEIPRFSAVNVHFGLSPYYRGNNTLFWPLYFNDFDHLGGCIHHINSGIDTGNILAEVYPALTSSDGEIAVDYQTTLLLADAMVHYLKTSEKKRYLPGKPQIEKGRNFNKAERTTWISMKYLLKRMIGLSCPPKRSGRIVTHFSHSVPAYKKRAGHLPGS